MKKYISYIILIILIFTTTSCSRNYKEGSVETIININEFYGIEYEDAVEKLGELKHIETMDSLTKGKSKYITNDGKIEIIFEDNNKKLSVISINREKDNPIILNEENDIFNMLNISKGKNIKYAKFYPIFFDVDDNGYISEIRLESEDREYPKSGLKLSVFFKYNE
ncbi:hypothetical protein [Miniphocaeibacter massiliensis]|uniref:hypothetical protein n=1 Tax=Miniphocaeibacter massiliensis TaxID=2041841 RepID=UPI000C076CF7|nr:hypothetical protein [Miniphocaeibacter massiliensis]